MTDLIRGAGHAQELAQPWASVESVPYSVMGIGGGTMLLGHNGQCIGYVLVLSESERHDPELDAAVHNTLARSVPLETALRIAQEAADRFQERAEKAEAALDAAFDFLGGVDGASEIRGEILNVLTAARKAGF
jgi:hypothetical protein